MAYMNQKRKSERMPAIKSVLKKYDMKGSVSVRNHMTLAVTLSSGPLDIGDVNEYWIDRQYAHDPVARDFLLELKDAMMGADYYNRTDIQTDYFDCSHYISINAGKWNKPYVFTGEKQQLAA